MDTAIIVHYSEIAIKGKNRPWFEKLLVENIKKQLQGLPHGQIKRIVGRVVIEPTDLKEKDYPAYQERLSKVFGLSDFSFVHSVKQDLEQMKKAVALVMKDCPGQTFRVLTKSSNKQFPMTSLEVNKALGEYVVKEFGKTLDLVDAEHNVYVEIVNNYCFVYGKKIAGPGGLPVGASGKVAVLLSGGIDSPVAAWYVMKRGCSPLYIHFHSHPYTNAASKEKVERLAKLLARYKPESKMYLVPFIDIQKQIMTKTDKKYRVILYRRYMMRIAEAIARKEGAKALVTGENLAQVASQTTDNMASIQDATRMLMMRPLLCFDKQEIINKAIEIGTYETSIEPHEDCCSLFVPQHPATASDSATLQKLEQEIDSSLIAAAVTASEKKHITY
jgi:thiamine biosynthesis protein ThiI